MRVESDLEGEGEFSETGSDLQDVALKDEDSEVKQKVERELARLSSWKLFLISIFWFSNHIFSASTALILLPKAVEEAVGKGDKGLEKYHIFFCKFFKFLHS